MTCVKKIVLWGMSTLTVLVLLFGYRTSTSSSAATAGGTPSAESPVGGGAGATSASGSATSGTGTGDGGAAASGSGPSSTSPRSSAPSPSASSPATTTVTGAAADTRYGPVQVQLTVASRKITAVRVVEYPDSSGRDQRINAEALPVLVRETLAAQSARIDMVSGATYTSDGYVSSLQSALDKAGI